jgi:alkylation response protein AidB-like acyl-CoA dehydrogenase
MTTTASRTDALLDTVAGLVPLIEASADEGERERRLPPALVDAFTEARLFKLCVPRGLGGDELDFLSTLRVFEAVARVDGAAGWTLMIGAEGGLFTAFLDEEGGREVTGDERTILAGSLNPNGRAAAVDGGYRVTGQWPFASGCQHSQWLLGTTILFEDGRPKMEAGGTMPVMLSTFSPAAECTILDTWKVAGLRGTGSHDFTVSDAFVPGRRAFSMMTTRPRFDGPLYRFPIVSFLSLGIGAVALGIARHAIDALVELASAKTPTGARSLLRERGIVQTEVAEAEGVVLSARAFFYEATAEAWQDLEAGREVDMPGRARLRLAAANAARSAARAIDLMYDAGGGSSLYEKCPLERCLRDIRALTQHIAVATPNYEGIGRVFLGLDPGTPRF